MTESPHIFLFTALASEAKPLVAHFKLKKSLQSQAFTIYNNDRYCVTVTGIGKASVAAAVAYTMALLAKRANPILINIGIAGHRERALGSVCLAEKLIDTDSGRSFYPSLIFSAPCPTISVSTVSRPDTLYQHEGLIEMEATAFYQTAVIFSGAELVHCLKIVSDNQQRPADAITPRIASDLVMGSIVTIDRLIQELIPLQQLLDNPEPESYQQILSLWHFSVSEQSRLLQLLKQYQTLNGPDLPVDFHSGKDLLRWLEQANQTLAQTMRLA